MIRPSAATDDIQIRDLLDAAFKPSRYESCLRDIVVQDSLPHWEWVWEEDSRVIAYILYTFATHGSMMQARIAPVAVHPSYQNRGIGSAIIRESLALDPVCDRSVFVLGDPAFYERFGFSKPLKAVCPYDTDNQHFRALRWEDPQESFTIRYSEAFAKAEQAVICTESKVP